MVVTGSSTTMSTASSAPWMPPGKSATSKASCWSVSVPRWAPRRRRLAAHSSVLSWGAAGAAGGGHLGRFRLVELVVDSMSPSSDPVQRTVSSASASACSKPMADSRKSSRSARKRATTTSGVGVGYEAAERRHPLDGAAGHR